MTGRSKSKVTEKANDEPQVTMATPANVAMTTEQFQMLLQTMQESMTQQTNRIATSTPVPQSNGNFAKCTTRFNGSSELVEGFIDAVETYKDCLGVSDENALRGFSMLLEKDASTWWQGMKAEISEWSVALQRFRDAFGPKKPPFQIYKDLFAMEQKNDNAERFMSKCKALLAQLPYTLEEKVQIDMIYGLLNRQIRKHIPREECGTFVDLARKCRAVEANYHEKGNGTEDQETNLSTKNRKKCVFCKKFGHIISECTTKALLQKKKEEKVNKAEEPKEVPLERRRPNITCYGCGAPGVIRANCSACSPKPSVEATEATFNGVETDGRYGIKPILPIKICNAYGTGMADTGANRSIAGRQLYELLKKNECRFINFRSKITFADGNTKVSEILQTEVDVSIHGKTVKTEFLILPELRNNRTLLGTDFISKAGIMLDIANGGWYFSSTPHKSFNFAVETPQPDPAIDVVEISAINVALRPDEGIDLSQNERKKLEELLERKQTLFGEVGPATEYAEHCITLQEGCSPPSQPPYRLPGVKRELLRKEIEKLLETGIIAECESAYAAPCILIPKSNGKMRLCIDYREINKITIGDRYPMPRMDDLLQNAKGFKLISSMDLSAGYYQINVKKEDRDKTAFVTPFGMYRFNRMPFGLRNAPATFQRLVDRMKSGLDINVFAYFDDLLVLSDDLDKHLKDLECIFDRLQRFGLRLNREKCVFARTSVKFLGHVLSTDGISVNPEKVAAIANMVAPRNVTQVKSFLQTCSWYRKFIENFSKVSEPLSWLTRKSSPWTWGDAQERAFQTLKTLLTTAPVLRQADETMPFMIRTDASAYAIGAALLQGEGPDEQPIEYASRLLNDAEKNYHTTEREALAIVWALKKFHAYIECSSVKVATDHQPLRYLMNLKSPSGRLARWALQIQQYDIQIEYTPGKANVLADMLSRPNIDDDIDKGVQVCQVVADFPRRSAEDIRRNQLEDPELAKIVSEFETEPPRTDFVRWVERGYIMSQGCLYKLSSDSDSDEPQLVVPAHERKFVVEQFHNETSCHDGIEKTLERIRRRYFWTGMRKFVEGQVRVCPECQRYKASNLKPAGLISTPPPAARFEVVAVDYFGPLPETEEGYRWVMIVEDVSSRWVEMFPLCNATAMESAKVLVEEVFLRYGIPRRLLSDNGVQFVSEVMQQVCHCLGIRQTLTPLYHAESNPVERKNRDLKAKISILVGTDHLSWAKKLAAVRYALNTGRCEGTGYTPAFLTFGRELRSGEDVQSDLRQIIEYDNFVPMITPYLKRLSIHLREAQERSEKTKEESKARADEKRRDVLPYKEGDVVLVKTHVLSNAAKGLTKKFTPRRDGPYTVRKVIGNNVYELQNGDHKIIGRYHTVDLTPYTGEPEEMQPVNPIRRRGRPRNQPLVESGPPEQATADPEGEYNAGSESPPSRPVRYAQVPARYR